MLSVVRKETIKNKLLANKSVTVKDLAQLMDVTEETIRRDLRELETDGIARKTHGGAVLREKVMSSFTRTEHKPLLNENKVAIAKMACSYLANGLCIFLDASTTVHEIIKMIGEYHVTIVSNSIDVMMECSNNPNINLLGLGGTFKHQHRSFSGSMTKDLLAPLYFDIVFFSCRTISMECGFAESDEEAELKRYVIEHSRKRIAMVDHTKFDAASFMKICDVEKADELLTDFPVSDAWVQFLKDKNVNLRVASKVFNGLDYVRTTLRLTISCIPTTG